MAVMTFEVAEAVAEKSLSILGREKDDVKLYLSRKPFGDVMFEALKIAFPDMSFKRVDDLEIDVGTADGQHHEGDVLHAKITLDRLFKTFEGSDPVRLWNRLVGILLEIQHSVRTFENPDVLKDAGPELLVPLLKLRSQVNAWNQEVSTLPGMPASRDKGFLNWPVAGQVVITLAMDLPEKYAFVTGEHLKTLGLSADDARDRAMENFKTIAANNPVKTNYRKEIVEISGVGGLASSLILWDDFWQREALRAKDALVIFVREWDELLVVRLSDRQTCGTMALAVQLGQLKLIFNGAIFVYDDKGMRQASPIDLLG